MDDNSSQGAISKQAQAAMILKERKANNAWHKFQRNKSAMVGLVIRCNHGADWRFCPADSYARPVCY